MEAVVHFRLPETYDAQRIGRLLNGRFAYRMDAPAGQTRQYLDTFDWRLFGKSLVLFCQEDQLLLRDLRGQAPAVRCDWTAGLVFADHLPHGRLRDQVQPILGPRALLPVASVVVQTIVYRVLNRDDKTVVLLLYTTVRTGGAADGAQTAYLSLSPVRGYGKHARNLAQELGPGPPIPSVEEAILHESMEAQGRAPGNYSAKLDLQLDPRMRSDDAAKAILRALLATLRANEDGVRNDTDIEFLHDYRVAVRKTRSALSQIKDVFPVDVTERYKQGFRELGQRTNALRDLDVYLQAEAAYCAMLPESLRDELAPLFDYLRSQRAEVLAQTVGDLESDETQELLAAWDAFLSEPGGESSAANAAAPIADLARQRIYRLYRRIVKNGDRLVAAPDGGEGDEADNKAKDEALHALRIECKKLRYLLEFFASLFPVAETESLVRELKKLQDNLGEFNDLSVQQAHLLEIAGQLPLEDERTARALVATGALVQALARQQDAVRREFGVRFAGFASNKNCKLYRRLFAGG